MLQQRIALYDHIDAFIVKYESIPCGEYGGPCIEFFVDHAFVITGYSGTGHIYTFIDNREKLLADPEVSDREREIIGNEIAPLIAYMLWLENNTFQTNETFGRTLYRILR
ncbi:MAG: hypothetical protein IPH93_13205 [Saprospiraceae bacterium]|nr:hypothetical protein [Saprospiraceae bacterium]